MLRTIAGTVSASTFAVLIGIALNANDVFLISVAAILSVVFGGFTVLVAATKGQS